ncbi:MAG: DegT/DnrJ/EryC1/StrS family aminotransferase [bacterium]|nr:DegT/DnrJ/EryC1/StrS family aminotransferase [bacterium]MCY3651782.1 DegT/DnrJ/EryC1/StrS family aminotransferase [bacterium]
MTRPARVGLSDPGRQLLMLGDQVGEAVERVLGSGVFLAGSESAALEGEFAAWLGRDAGLCVSSGSSALESILYALGVGNGDAVAVTSNLDISAVAPIVRLGAEPAWVDVVPGTTGMSVDDLDARWDGRIRAILLVHTHGYPAAAQAAARLGREKGVPLIEDITHAPGAWLGGERVGTFGRAAIMSCAPTKPLAAVGSLGLIAADDTRLIRRAREYASYGFELAGLEALHRGQAGPHFDYVTAGINGLPDELSAAIVRAKLPLMDGWADRRRAKAALYDDLFARVGQARAVPVGCPPKSSSAPRSYVIQAEDRDSLAKDLGARDIGVSYNYVPSLHRQRVFATDDPVDLPATDRLDDTILGLPNAPENRDSETEYVLEVLEYLLTQPGAVR